MAYSDFSLEDLENKFGIKNQTADLFDEISPIKPSQNLENALSLARELPVRSEKAKSEMIILPILLELRIINNKYFTIYSGENLNIDDQLKGECDFILAKDVNSFTINYPIVQIVEAKKSDIGEGIKQCAAQLLGAKSFNEKKDVHLDKLYGCSTTGDDWQFLKLENNTIFVDKQKFYLGEIEELLGVFQIIIDYYKKVLI
jgi:hypothetical protein